MKSLVLRIFLCVILCAIVFRSCVFLTDNLAVPAEYEVNDFYNKQSVDLNLSPGQTIALTASATFHAESNTAFQFLLMTQEKTLTSVLEEQPLGWEYNQYWSLDGELSPGVFRVTTGNPQIRIKGENFRVTVMQRADTYTAINAIAIIILIVLSVVIVIACFSINFPRFRLQVIKIEE